MYEIHASSQHLILLLVLPDQVEVQKHHRHGHGRRACKVNFYITARVELVTIRLATSLPPSHML